MNESLEFTVYMKPEPQGSARAFVVKGRAVVTSDNKRLRPFRSELTRAALWCLNAQQLPQPMCPKGVPVSIAIQFSFAKPQSVPKSRRHPVVKPDADKLIRAVLDSLTGVAFHDDAQVVDIGAKKVYGPQDSVTVSVMAWQG